MKLEILTIFLFVQTSISIDENLINKFFRSKLCTMGTILNCNTKYETVSLLKKLMLKGFRISAFNIAYNNFSTKAALAKSDNNLAIVVNGDCNDTETILTEATQHKYFFETYRWLIYGSNYDDLMEKMQNVPLEINVDVTVAVATIDDDDDNGTITNWTIYDVYNPAFKHGGDLKVEEVGWYDVSTRKYNVEINRVKYYKRRNMTGVLFKSVMVVPEVISTTLDEYLANEKDRFNNTFTRFHSVTIDNCQEFFNFTNNRTMMHSWGYQQPDGDVDGMLKELKEKRIDFGNAPLMYRLYRVKLVDYGYGNWIMRSAFIFRHPKSTLTSSEIYLRPLGETVWLTTVAFVILLIIILRIIITRQSAMVDTDPEHAHQADWSFLLLYGIGELCQQGYALIPAFVSGKMVTFTVLIFSFLIYQFYSASIVSLLLMEPPKTIKTLNDLLKSPLKAGCEDSLFDRDYLKKTTDPVAIELYNTKIKRAHNNSNFYLANVGLEKVTRGGYAFHAQTSTAYPIIEKTFSERVICSLSEVQMYPNEYIYMIIQKHSPFRELFNYCMFHQMEVGIMRRLRIFWNARRPICIDPTNYLEISVGIKESYWGLMILGFGYVLCVIILGFEIFLSKERNLFNFKVFKKVKNFNKLGPIEPYTN